MPGHPAGDFSATVTHTPGARLGFKEVSHPFGRVIENARPGVFLFPPGEASVYENTSRWWRAMATLAFAAEAAAAALLERWVESPQVRAVCIMIFTAAFIASLVFYRSLEEYHGGHRD